MKKSSLIYLFLGIGQIITGILGSYFVFIVSGLFFAFRFLSAFLVKSAKPVKTILSIVFTLINLYFIYYSSFMLISELDYASFRPQTWIIIPIAVSLIVLIALFLFTKDSFSDEDIVEKTKISEWADRSVEDFTIFALILIGWLGTYVFEFYFEYSAAFCITVCSLKNYYDFLFPKQNTNNTTHLSDENNIIAESEQAVKET
jgi:hypothetical protein